jgi:SAM-dependent methyltransferase
MNIYHSEKKDRREIQTDDPFILDDLRQMALAPEYNSWIYSLLKLHLGQRILEIGPGIGNISAFMLKDAQILVGMEPNQYCAGVLLDQFGENPKFQLLESRLEEAHPHELRKYNFDTIVCANVLEHIANDIDAVKILKDCLVPGGKLILWVPAIPQVYGPIDAAIGHFRRYTKKTLLEVLDINEFQTTHLFYSNFVGLLGWAFNAYIKRATQQSDEQIKIFNKLVPIIANIESRISLPVGLSLIAVSSKT